MKNALLLTALMFSAQAFAVKTVNCPAQIKVNVDKMDLLTEKEIRAKSDRSAH